MGLAVVFSRYHTCLQDGPEIIPDLAVGLGVVLRHLFEFAQDAAGDALLNVMDVEATRAIRQAEVGAAKTMIERIEERFDINPAYLAADTAYG